MYDGREDTTNVDLLAPLRNRTDDRMTRLPKEPGQRLVCSGETDHLLLAMHECYILDWAEKRCPITGF